MEKIKNYFSTKRYGFYVILSTIVLALISLIVFFLGRTDGYFSWVSFGFAIALVLGDASLIAIKKDQFVPALNTICSGLILGFFIEACYTYVSAVLTGIDLETFTTVFTVYAILAVALFIVSAATIFMPITKQVETKESEEK